MGAWFESLGLEFKNIGGITYTENIGWGPYSCSEEDCTEELEDALRSTFDFFMSEAGQAYRPHYNSVMNNGFKEMGLGIAVDERAKRYYVTVHYGTQIVSGPEGFALDKKAENSYDLRNLTNGLWVQNSPVFGRGMNGSLTELLQALK